MNNFESRTLLVDSILDSYDDYIADCELHNGECLAAQLSPESFIALDLNLDDDALPLIKRVLSLYNEDPTLTIHSITEQTLAYETSHRL